MLVGTRKESERMGEEWLILILKYSLRIALTIIYFMYAEKIEKIAYKILPFLLYQLLFVNIVVKLLFLSGKK